MSSAVVKQAVDRTFRMDYGGAEESILQGLPASSPARAYFAGTVCLNRFVDWGDTAALSRAEAWWERLTPTGDPDPAYRSADPQELRLYRGLAGFQLSYVSALRGGRFRPAALALAARQQLLTLDRPEAKASLMLYAYYRGQILGKLPFVGPAEFPTAAFRQAADASPALRDMFLSSLAWILVERASQGEDARQVSEDYKAALKIAEGMIERYPGNRLAREMRGSILYRSGRLMESRVEYEALREEYRALPKSPERLPLGYYREVGNLARVYLALGLRPEARASLGEWRRSGTAGVWPWLPASLKKDLDGK